MISVLWCDFLIYFSISKRTDTNHVLIKLDYIAMSPASVIQIGAAIVIDVEMRINGLGTVVKLPNQVPVPNGNRLKPCSTSLCFNYGIRADIPSVSS